MPLLQPITQTSVVLYSSIPSKPLVSIEGNVVSANVGANKVIECKVKSLLIAYLLFQEFTTMYGSEQYTTRDKAAFVSLLNDDYTNYNSFSQYNYQCH